MASGSSDKSVRLWDASGKPGAVLKRHGNTAHSVTWSPDGQRVLSGGMDGILCLWNPAELTAVWIKDLSQVGVPPP